MHHHMELEAQTDFGAKLIQTQSTEKVNDSIHLFEKMIEKISNFAFHTIIIMASVHFQRWNTEDYGSKKPLSNR